MLTSQDSNDELDALLAEIDASSTGSEESNSSNDDTVVTPSSNKETDEEYLNDPDNGNVKEIPKGKEKYYGL